MQPDYKKQRRQLEQTRAQLAGLQSALLERLFTLYRDHGLIRKRAELQDPAVRQQCLSHPFDSVTRSEVEVIVSQLRPLGEGMARLKTEIDQLASLEEKERRVVYDLPPAPKPTPQQISRSYGAPELKRYRQKHMSWALGIASIIAFCGVGIYWLTVYLQPAELIEKKVRITKYIELEPPPSIADDLNQPAGGDNLLGGSTSGIIGVLGVIVPVSDKDKKNNGIEFLVSDNSIQDLDRLLSQAKLRTGSGGGTYGEGGLGLGSGRGSGRGRSSADQAEDQVVLDEFNVAALGNVDQLITEAKGVETVKLEKRGQVNIQAPGEIRGSETARVQRSAESVMGVINGQQARMMYIYNKHLRINPDMRGKLNIDLTIEADGAVSNIAVVESNIGSEEFVRELLGLLRRLRFEKITEGSVTVNLPLVFNRTE
ncbi:MAG TPA: AgmX/PglI C-terminal domain-containing protein [bacterium]|nr:AgmX/PglI C-terminal domain-containing protein [bacterium]HOH07663.1 AgmX/PglI C-terminal domain-containing protein [bacterium]HOY45847.1 AgmX/PglI C-terminal domain-containing protein [bacterium]HPG84169.1 AgmX/PglI C-terminal domain-containing protein [bacterium]HPM60075.1 AgmX/PglI C-terminal domain-containing protein [bacterium]